MQAKLTQRLRPNPTNRQPRIPSAALHQNQKAIRRRRNRNQRTRSPKILQAKPKRVRRRNRREKKTKHQSRQKHLPPMSWSALALWRIHQRRRVHLLLPPKHRRCNRRVTDQFQVPTELKWSSRNRGLKKIRDSNRRRRHRRADLVFGRGPAARRITTILRAQ
jgi:hypothetical protein